MSPWRREPGTAWRGSTRKGRLPPNWESLRTAVLKRCGHRCEWFSDNNRCFDLATDVDHIIAGDNHALENLQGLCRSHHLTKTSREAKAAWAERKALERLPEEHQPGIIQGPPQPTQHRGF